MLTKFLTPSFFIGLAVAAIISAAEAVSVYNGDFDTVTFVAFGAVVGTAILRGVGIYIASKITQS